MEHNTVDTMTKNLRAESFHKRNNNLFHEEKEEEIKGSTGKQEEC
jgi:hypothetical protein